MSGDVHVLPVADLLEHVESRGCWCRPTVDPVGASAIVTHHSADGREYFEPDGPCVAEPVQ